MFTIIECQITILTISERQITKKTRYQDKKLIVFERQLTIFTILEHQITIFTISESNVTVFTTLECQVNSIVASEQVVSFIRENLLL